MQLRDLHDQENSTASNYQFTDKNPVTDINYYRLNMVDKDKAQQYSNLISFRLGEKPMPAS